MFIFVGSSLQSFWATSPTMVSSRSRRSLAQAQNSTLLTLRQEAGFSVWGLGFRVQHLAFRVFEVEGLKAEVSRAPAPSVMCLKAVDANASLTLEFWDVPP